MKLRATKIREALSVAVGHAQKASAESKRRHNWFTVKARFQALTDAELAEAEQIERLGRRNQNLLRIIDLEKRRRAGDRGRRKLRAEANL